MYMRIVCSASCRLFCEIVGSGGISCFCRFKWSLMISFVLFGEILTLCRSLLLGVSLELVLLLCTGMQITLFVASLVDAFFFFSLGIVCAPWAFCEW